MPSPLLTVIIITHNSSQWLEGFFRSLSQAADVAGLNAAEIEILVGDDASIDETLKLIPFFAPAAKVFATAHPAGFGAAANRVIAYAVAEWVLLCNADLTLDREFLRQLFPKLLHLRKTPTAEKIGVVAPLLLNPDGSPQPSIGRFPSIRGLIADQFRPRPQRKYVFPQPAKTGYVDWAMGACLLLSAQACRDVQGFDEKYFLYVEEVDLQRRLADAGWKCCFVREAIVTHHQPNANRDPRPEVQRWAAAGVLRYFAKFGRGGQLAACRLLILVSRRLPVGWVLASRKMLLERPTNFTK